LNRLDIGIVVCNSLRIYKGEKPSENMRAKRRGSQIV
jgi:hypothetical protein